MSELLAIGVSHKTAAVAVRERLALPAESVGERLGDLWAAGDVHELVTISTCNRTELYLVVADPARAESRIQVALARRAGMGPTELAGALYSHRNRDAVRHLYRVTAGLESMILGESEIQGQVKRAYNTALEHRTVGPLGSHLFKRALATGKRVRTETAIAERQVGLPAVAVRLAHERLGDLAGRQAIVIGAGETSEQTGRSLRERGSRVAFVAARRRERAAELARRYGGESLGLDELAPALGRADVVVSATASPHPLLDRTELARVMDARGGRSLLLIDLAVPRDFDPSCAEIEGVSLVDIDDLEAVTADNRRIRRLETQKAEGIVAEEVESFAAWLGSATILPTLAALRIRAQDLAAEVVLENRDKWETASPRDLARVDAIAHAVVNRLLHHPTVRLKESRGRRAHARAALVCELFDLGAYEPPAAVRRGSRA